MCKAAHAFACGAGVPFREIRKEPLYAPFVCLVIYRVPSAGRVYGMGCVEQAACTNAPMHLLNAPMHLLNAPMHQCSYAPMQLCTQAPMHTGTNVPAMHTRTRAHTHLPLVEHRVAMEYRQQPRTPCLCHVRTQRRAAAHHVAPLAPAWGGRQACGGHLAA